MWRFPGSLTAGHGDAHCDVDAAAGEAGPGMACAGVDPGLVVADEACLSSEDEGVSGGQGEVGAGVTVIAGVAQPEGAPVTEAEGYGQIADALAVVMVDAQVLARPGGQVTWRAVFPACAGRRGGREGCIWHEQAAADCAAPRAQAGVVVVDQGGIWPVGRGRERSVDDTDGCLADIGEPAGELGDTLAVWDTGVSRRWLLVPAEPEGPDRHLVATRQRGGPDGEGPGGPFMESRGDLSLLGHIQPARQVDGAGPAARALYL